MFRSIVFGYADAHTESAEAPELLTEGYFEFSRVTKEVYSGHRFLVLGYKGAGKSAIAERLKLLAAQDSMLFVTTPYLSDFPYADLSEIDAGVSDKHAALSISWQWLLLLKLLDSFAGDEPGLAAPPSTEVASAVGLLQGRGLLPTGEFKNMVVKSRKGSLTAEFPVLSKLSATLESEYEQKNMRLVSVVERLRQIILGFRSQSRHFIVIDGLDDILSSASVQYEAVEALVRTASRLNHDLRSNDVPAKILVLCRTDLFERLPGPNKTKVRMDHGVHLNWFANPRAPQNSDLVRLANLRARVGTGGAVTDLFGTCFPAQVDKIPIVRYLLDNTRHTPRDFLQLLTAIQKFAPDGVVSRGHILAGIREYSIEYFLPAVRDELAGYIEPDESQRFFELLGSLRKREMTGKELASQAESVNVKPDRVHAILRALFECSAIGTIHTPRSRRTFYTFRYRNRNATLVLEDRILLHRGLWKALNVP